MKSSSIFTIFSLTIVFALSFLSIKEGNINPLSFFSDSYTFKSKDILEGSGESKVEVLKDRPEVRLQKWNGEVDLGVSYKNVEGKAEKSLFEDKVIWKDENNTKEEVHAYPLEAKAGMENGGFEIEVVLNEKPATNKFDFKIDGAEDLDFFYQPDMRNNPKVHQADNVIGSYAVYHKTKKNYTEGGVNYGTGKAYHIYRPKAIDATGKEQWAELHYDGKGVLSVTVPQEFLDTAVYPLIVDPTFGYTTCGGTSTGSSSGNTNYLEMTENSPAGTNTLTNISICYTPVNGAQTVQFGFYSDSGSDAPVNRLAYDSVPWAFGATSKQFYTNPVAFNYTLSPNTKYWAAEKHETGTDNEFWFDQTGGTVDLYYEVGVTLPATVGSPTKESDIRSSVYATYSSAVTDSSNANVNIRGGGSGTASNVKVRGGSKTPAFVQGSNCLQFSGTTLTCTFASSASTDNLVAFGVGWNSNTITLDSVTGTCVSGPTIVNNLVTGIRSGAQGYQQIQSATPCTVIFNFSSSVFASGLIHEISSYDQTTPVANGQYTIQDQEDPGMGVDAVTSGNIITTRNNTYIFGWTFTPSGGISDSSLLAGSGFTKRGGALRSGSEDKIQNSAGTTAGTWTQSAGAFFDWTTGVMAIQGSGTSGSVRFR